MLALLARTNCGRSLMTAVSILCLVAHWGQVAAGNEMEIAAARKVEAFGGKASMHDGRVRAVFLWEKRGPSQGLLADDDIRSIGFGALSEIAVISVYGKNITDRSLAEFQKVRTLTHFEIMGAQITDPATCNYLKNATALQWLTLLSVPISDATLIEVGKLRELKRLHLTNLHITDKGIKELARLRLEHLTLARNEKITDDALEEIGKLETLRTVDLTASRVTDKGLLHLGRLKNLEKLTVSATDVTNEGCAALQRLLPKLTIEMRPATFFPELFQFPKKPQ